LRYCFTFYGLIDVLSTHTFYVAFLLPIPGWALPALFHQSMQSITIQMTTKEAAEAFRQATGGTLRIYRGQRRMVDDVPLSTLATEPTGTSVDIDTPQTVGDFGQKMQEVLGITVQVSSSDDWQRIPQTEPLGNIKRYSRKTTSGHIMRPLK